MQPYWGSEQIHDVFSALMNRHKLDRQKELLVGDEGEPLGNIAVVGIVHFKDGVLIQKHPKFDKVTGAEIHVHTLPSEKISLEDIINVKRLIGEGVVALEEYHLHLFVITFLRCLIEEHAMSFDGLAKIRLRLQSLYLNPDNNKWLIHIEVHIPVNGKDRLKVKQTDDGIIKFDLIRTERLDTIKGLLLESDNIGKRSHDKTYHQHELLEQSVDGDRISTCIEIDTAQYLGVILKAEV